MNPSGHDDLKREQGVMTRALEAEARVEELERRVDSLWLELETERSCHRQDNEYLLGELKKANPEGYQAVYGGSQ